MPVCRTKKQSVPNSKQNRIPIKNRSFFLPLLFYCAAFILLFALIYPISPLCDDWHYLTAPDPAFSISSLLPANTFWRPFDALVGGFLGLFPGLFPVFNQAAVVLGHVLNAVFLNLILLQMNIAPKWRKFSVCYFLFSSAVWAVTTNTDALNQAYSVLCGLIAIYLHLKRGGYGYLFWCILAILWKESGVSWFFVIPIFDAILNAQNLRSLFQDRALLKKCILEAVLSVVVICGYFAARFGLYGSVTLGADSGRYHISIFSLSTLKNIALLLASACTGVDTIALLGNSKSALLAGVTIFFSFLFLAVWAASAVQTVFRKKEWFPVLGLSLCVLGLAAPLSILGPSAEMHAYPVLCAVAILCGFCFDRADIDSKKVQIGLLCIFLAFTISSAHKLVAIYDYSQRTQDLTQNLLACYTSADSALFVEVGYQDGYSVFTQTAMRGSAKGLSLRPYYNWQHLNHEQYLAQSMEDAQSYIEANHDRFASIYIIQAESVTRVK